MKPRRCSKRWLDGDCPSGVLAIIDHGNIENESERYDVFYTQVSEIKYGVRAEYWMQYYCVAPNGGGYHGEMEARQVVAYRYGMKHRYARWSDLPEAVKSAVRRDLAG